MPNPPPRNRTMFWRIVRRLLAANRARLFVLLLALGAGAAITAALLNLQVDAKRRLTTEFRAFGANVIVVPRRVDASGAPQLFLIRLERMPNDPRKHRRKGVPLFGGPSDLIRRLAPCRGG